MPQTKAWNARREREFAQARHNTLLDNQQAAASVGGIATHTVEATLALPALQGKGRWTFRQLRTQAGERGLDGRSTMNKQELEDALKA